VAGTKKKSMTRKEWERGGVYADGKIKTHWRTYINILHGLTQGVSNGLAKRCLGKRRKEGRVRDVSCVCTYAGRGSSMPKGEELTLLAVTGQVSAALPLKSSQII
jgi:hypothetical protein